MIFSLPDCVIDKFLSFLSQNDLLEIRLVCKHGKEAATRVLSLRNDMLYIHCCWDFPQIHSKWKIFQSVQHIVYEFKSNKRHQLCNWGRRGLFYTKIYFGNIQKLTLIDSINKNSTFYYSLDYCQMLFSNLMYLELYHLSLNESDTCSALKQWHSLKVLIIKKCSGVTLSCLNDINENIVSVTMKDHLHCINCCPPRSVPLVTSETLHTVLPRLESFSFSLSDTNTQDYRFNEFNVYKFIKASSCLRSVRLRLSTCKMESPFLCSKTIRRLRLHLEGDVCKTFQLVESNCETLEMLELKFKYIKPTTTVIRNLSKSFHMITHLTLTVNNLSLSNEIFDTTHYFTRMKEFTYRNRGFRGITDHCSEETNPFLRYIFYTCPAEKVSLHLDKMHGSGHKNSSSFINFVYKIIECATRRKNVNYHILFSFSVGCFVLPPNVTCSTIFQFRSMKTLWNEEYETNENIITLWQRLKKNNKCAS